MFGKTIWVALAGLFLGLGYSPEAEAQVSPIRFRVDGSLNFSYINSNFLSWSDIGDNSIAGYRLGASVDIPLSSAFILSPSLAIVSKGTTENTSLSRLWADKSVSSFKVRTHYLQLPVYAGVRIPLFGQMGLSVLAGPYFAYALHSEASVTEDGVKTNYSNMIRTGWNNIKTNQFDLGLGAVARLDLGGWYLVAGADFGGLKTFTNAPSGDKLKNTTVNLGVGLSL